jgi:uncharacterized cupredoxin-like copper-binding protein
MRMSRSLWIGGALLLAACGGGMDDAASTDLEAVATEFDFEPDTWTVPAGEEITMTLDNQGEALHEWVIIEQGTILESSADFEEEMVIWEIEADPGTTEVGTFTSPAAGTYQIVCVIPNHLESGMVGELEVV